MKATIRVPMVEPYAYIEVEMEGDEHEIIGQYRKLKDAVVGGFGLDTKAFSAALDEFISTGTLRDGVEIYGQMSPSQQAIFQELKKSIKRINYKLKKQV